MTDLDTTAPAFVEMAHRIVWCTVATVGPDGRPRSRILHPIWEWDGSDLRGWIATSPESPKAAHLAANPHVTLSYWTPEQDTCTAECTATFDDEPAAANELWRRFADAPAPLGYDPSIIPGWESPESPGFGVLTLQPYRLRVFPGSLLLTGQGELLTWSR